MAVAGIVIGLLLAAVLAATGGGKLAGQASSLQIRDGLRVTPRVWTLIGVLEAGIVVLLVVGAFARGAGLVGLAGVVALMVGAVLTRLRAPGPRGPGLTADAVILLLAVAGALLRLG